MNPKKEFNTVAVVGAGVIGLSWARLFAEYGMTVRVTDPRPDLAEVVPDGVLVAPSVAEAVRDADFVQENGPENLEFKKNLFAELLREAGLAEIEETVLTVSVEHATFDEWWEPFTFGVGTVGAYLSQLDGEQQTRLREHCRAAFPEEGLVLAARAWAASGRLAG